MLSHQPHIGGTPAATLRSVAKFIPAEVFPFAARRTYTVKTAASQDSVNPSGLQLALKEWAVTCAALGQGDQTVLLWPYSYHSSAIARASMLRARLLHTPLSWVFLLCLLRVLLLCLLEPFVFLNIKPSCYSRSFCAKAVSGNQPLHQQLKASYSFRHLFIAKPIC